MSDQTDSSTMTWNPGDPVYQQSTQQGGLAKAMSDARQKFATIERTKQGYGYKYAPLDEVFKATNDALHKAGIGFQQHAIPRDGKVYVLTRITHWESGEWQQSVYEADWGDGKPQTIGSIITYARRYALSPIFGVAPDEDDDGKAGGDGSVKTDRVAARKAAAQQTFNPDKANGNPPTQSEIEKAQKTTLDRLYAWAGANTASVQKVAWDTTRQILGLQPGEERTLDDWRTIYKWIEANKSESFDDVASKAMEAAQKENTDGNG